MQLIYFIYIFENSYDIASDRFEQPHLNRSWAILVWDKLSRDLMSWKSIELMLLLIYNDVIKSS